MQIAILGSLHPRGQAYRHAFPSVYEYAHLNGFDLSGLAIVTGRTPERPALLAEASAVAQHVLCETPFARTLAEAEAVVETCAARGVTLYAALPHRLLPALGGLKHMLAQGEVDQLISVKLEFQARRWPSDESVSAGHETMLEHLIQMADLLRWLTGAEVADVYAETGAGLVHADRAVDDGAVVSVTLSNDAYATLGVSLSLPPSYPLPEELRVEVIGSGGWAAVDAYRQNVDTYSDAGAVASNWGSQGLTELLRCLVNPAERGRLASADDGLRAQAVALAVYRPHLG
jgi:predicted dehydrogenase